MVICCLRLLLLPVRLTELLLWDARTRQGNLPLLTNNTRADPHLPRRRLPPPRPPIYSDRGRRYVALRLNPPLAALADRCKPERSSPTTRQLAEIFKIASTMPGDLNSAKQV